MFYGMSSCFTITGIVCTAVNPSSCFVHLHNTWSKTLCEARKKSWHLGCVDVVQGWNINNEIGFRPRSSLISRYKPSAYTSHQSIEFVGICNNETLQKVSHNTSLSRDVEDIWFCSPQPSKCGNVSPKPYPHDWRQCHKSIYVIVLFL